MNMPLQWGHGIAAVESELIHAIKPDLIMLQWGHGIAAVESLQERQSILRHLTASMGPRHCCRGIASFRGREGEMGEASMGPRHCCRGIAGRGRRYAPLGKASMGPRHCCRGIVSPS